MADEVDKANDILANQIMSALNKRRQDGPVKMGPKTCVECEEKIPQVRRTLGFKLCIECATRIERRGALMTTHY